MSICSSLCVGKPTAESCLVSKTKGIIPPHLYSEFCFFFCILSFKSIMYGGQFHGLQSQFNIRRQTIAIIIINHIKDFPGGSNSKESA